MSRGSTTRAVESLAAMKEVAREEVAMVGAIGTSDAAYGRDGGSGAQQGHAKLRQPENV